MVTRKHPRQVASALHKPKARDVPAKAWLFLFVRAGGRCEFDACNTCLLEHHLTKTEGNFAQMAHIWAFSERGPRGHESLVLRKLADVAGGVEVSQGPSRN